MAVESEDDRAVEALVSADLAVGAMLEDSIPPHLEAIATGGALPELGSQKINLYCGPSSGDEVTLRLSEMLRHGYCAPPALSLKQA